MAKASDIALIGGIALVAYLVIKGGRDLFGALSGFQGFGDIKFPEIKFPSINVGAPNIETTFPNIPSSDQAILEEIQKQGGLANLQTQQAIDLLKGLTPLGTPENPANAPTSPTATDVILNDPTLTQAQKEALLDIFNPKNLPNDPNADLTKFNPPNQESGFGADFQGPAIFPDTGESAFLDPNRPLDLTQFAAKLGITPAEAFKLQKNNPSLVEEIKQSPLFDVFSQKSFEVGGQTASGPQSFSIINNKPLTDIINQFKQLGFNLTASQAADIKAQLQPDKQVQDFDFGTNTGSALELAQANFGQGPRPDLELQKAIEAFKASANPVFGGTSNFANPNFPITLGEAFLGKKGTIVSNSISNLTMEQLEAFKEAFA